MNADLGSLCLPIHNVDSGLRALKFDPFPGPWRALVGRLALDEAIARVAAVREAVGPDVKIMIEADRRLAPMVAIAFARRIEAYRPFWFEEPISSRDLVSLAEVRAAVDVPVVTGEELYGMAEFRDVFVHRAADIVNPDVCATGGILELRQIAATAESHHVAVAPHQYNSLTCGLAATLHAAVGMPNLLIVEYFINHEQPSAAIATGGTLPWRIEDGALALPPGPGLGIELEESALTPASGASVAAGPQPRTRSADVAWERPFAGPQDEPRPV